MANANPSPREPLSNHRATHLYTTVLRNAVKIIPDFFSGSSVKWKSPFATNKFSNFVVFRSTIRFEAGQLCEVPMIISVGLSKDAASTLARNLLGEQFECSPEEMESLAGEILNTLYGKCKAELNPDANLPMMIPVSTRTQESFKSQVKSKIVSFPFFVDGHTLMIELSI